MDLLFALEGTGADLYSALEKLIDFIHLQVDQGLLSFGGGLEDEEPQVVSQAIR
jgi:hypothetical protein